MNKTGMLLNLVSVFSRQDQDDDVLRVNLISGNDCSSESEEVDRIKSEITSLNSTISSLNSGLESNKKRMNSEYDKENSVVLSEKERRRISYANAQREMNKIESELDTLEDRVRVIDTQSPVLASEIRALDRSIDSLKREIKRDEPIAKKAEEALSKFDKEVNWKAKSNALRTAENELNEAIETLSEAEANKKNQESIIETSITTRENLIRELVGLEQSLKETNQAYEDAIEALSSFRTEKARLESIGEKIESRLSESRGDYLELFNISKKSIILKFFLL